MVSSVVHERYNNITYFGSGAIFFRGSLPESVPPYSRFTLKSGGRYGDDLASLSSRVDYLKTKILICRRIRVPLVDQFCAVDIDQFIPLSHILPTTTAYLQTVYVN